MTAAAPAPVLAAEELSVSYRLGGGRTLPAVRGVSFALARGETLGVVGESGCGKSSLARAILRLAPVVSGRVTWKGREISALDEGRFRPLRPALQMVFQDPLAALNPRLRVEALIAEPLVTHFPALRRADRRARVAAATEAVGLRGDMLARFPHELSGGQAQRVGLARAVVSEPGVLICDEAVSALDVSVQALILSLLGRLQRERDLAMLFIGHDLAVIRQISHRVLVLYLGQVVEQGPREAVFTAPRHPYTEILLASALSSDPDVERGRARPAIAGEPPSPTAPPSGCVFRTRCPMATDHCAAVAPPLRPVGAGHEAACHYAEEVGA